MLPEHSLAPGLAKAYDVLVPLIETQIFLPWLQHRLQEKGVNFFEEKLNTLDNLSVEYDLVVNCTGLGARTLCKDETMVPIRGQVGLLAAGPHLPIYLDNEMPLYIVPRKDAIIIGGTFEEGVELAETQPSTIEYLLNNAYKVFPELQNQQVLGSWAGIRPYRPAVRVEREAGRNIIHNYGHGGSGFTLAFGCAELVSEQVGLFTG